MDSTLHCNDLKCRERCTDRAVVTTCSHIFCLPCADRLDLTNSRKCPACSTHLPNPDDAVVASLNPTEDYKTSILSGLSPTVIMECAGRGLSFWAYQMAQEITYQEYLARSLADRYSQLQQDMNTLSVQSQDETGKLRGKLEAIHAENVELAERLHALDQKYKHKDQELKKLQTIHTNLRNQVKRPNLESAANHEIDEVLQAGAAHREAQQQQQERPRGSGVHRSTSNNSGSSREYRQHTALQETGYGTQPHRSQALPERSALSTAQSSQVPAASQNRQHLPEPTFGRYNNTLHPGMSMASLRQGTPLRGNTALSGYQNGSPNGAPGLSANARSGRAPGSAYMPVPGSRAGGYGAVRPGLAPIYRH